MNASNNVTSIAAHPLTTPFTVHEYKKSRNSRTAIICCSHNGQTTLLTTLMAAKRQADVYLYDDASTDATAGIGRKLGITTIRGEVNIGKARGIRRMLDLRFASLDNRRIPEAYDYVMILDDDTLLNPQYIKKVQQQFDDHSDYAVLEGRLVSSWTHDQNFNGYIAARAFTSWIVHILLTWTQSLLRARTWINGAIAVYRADILDQVVRRDPKFITEDNDWCWQIHRKKMGRIKFLYRQTAKLQEPQTCKELYLQHLRWNWGMFQVAREHKTGTRLTRPDIMWIVLMLLTAHYMLMPIYTLVMTHYSMAYAKVALLWFLGRYVVYAIIGAIVSRQFTHIFLWPYFIVYDFNWRISVAHGLFKSIRKPTLDVVTWVSPTRHVETPEELAS